ncbi:hypothetical protein [Actinomyces gaoshouyii]|nr:hypothetical protein [Actinomyces gaoshouyii]
MIPLRLGRPAPNEDSHEAPAESERILDSGGVRFGGPDEVFADLGI